jgi:hypothetical protein
VTPASERAGYVMANAPFYGASAPRTILKVSNLSLMISTEVVTVPQAHSPSRRATQWAQEGVGSFGLVATQTEVANRVREER